jgi:hypothetical protein
VAEEGKIETDLANLNIDSTQRTSNSKEYYDDQQQALPALDKPMMRLNEDNTQSIPLLYVPYSRKTNKIAIYFHGNAEDIGLAFDMLF